MQYVFTYQLGLNSPPYPLLFHIVLSLLLGTENQSVFNKFGYIELGRLDIFSFEILY